MSASRSSNDHSLPGAELSVRKMPGHWLLARLGKRVLRPGGLELTRRLLTNLAIGSADDIVELAPGLGTTATLILGNQPSTYRGIERDEAAANFARRAIASRTDVQVLVGDAEATGLSGGSASVVIGEAMLTMQPQAHKKAIVAEAARLLRLGG